MKIFCTLLCLFLIAPIIIRARARAEEPTNRKILALYDSLEGKIEACNIHKILEMPLNRLGMVVDYHDINKLPLPDTSSYRAVAVWFAGEQHNNGAEYLTWLIRHIKAGGKVILMNNLGAEQTRDGKVLDQNLIRAAYNTLEIKEGPIGFLEDPFIVKVNYLHKNLFNYETANRPREIFYRDLKTIDPNADVWMTVSRSDVADSLATVIFTSKHGGFIAGAGYAVRFIDEPISQVKWDVNPFVFLQTALDCKGNLRPDTTTAFGNRAAFSHLDGDGEHNYVQDIPGGKQLATNILYNDILTKYPVPVTVSFIASLIAPEGGFDPKYLPLYKKIMALPNVQTAAHGYTHPMDWFNEVSGIQIKGYKYDVKQETVGALKLISKLICPPDKPAKLFLWTGDCMPKEDALAALASGGYYNMNGGDPRYDQLYDGICNICPLTRQLGPYRQVYAAGCNEYLYTDHWTENFGGYGNVIKTFINTTKPRYLPVNIYYHIYVCERQAGLRSLKKTYEWALSQKLCWLTGIEYCKSVLAFIRCSTGHNPEKNMYWISNYQGLNTVRLDNEKRVVDMTSSKNVLGFNHFNDSLYISLLPADKAEIKLADKPADHLYLVHSAGKLTDVKLTQDSLQAKVRLYAPGNIVVKFGEKTENILYSINGEAELQAKDGVIPLPAGKGEEVTLLIKVQKS